MPSRVAVRPEQQLDAYLAALERGDSAGAQRIARRLIEGGAEPVSVIRDLLGPAQHEVGVRWARGEWDEVMERVATSITDEVLTAMVSAMTSDPSSVYGGGTNGFGRVLVTTPRGEWHSMPARMISETFKAMGWRVTLAVPSMTPTATADFARRWGASFVALSATLTSNLASAWLTVGAVHDVGVPVLLGGRAFGGSEARARKLGGDGFAADAMTAQHLAAAWSTHPPRLRHEALDGERHAEVRALLRDGGRLASDSLDLLAGWMPSLGEGDEYRDALADLERLVGIVTAAVLVEDRTIVGEHLEWWSDRLRSQGHPLSEPGVWVDALSRVLPSTAVHARSLLDPESPDAST